MTQSSRVNLTSETPTAAPASENVKPKIPPPQVTAIPKPAGPTGIPLPGGVPAVPVGNAFGSQQQPAAPVTNPFGAPAAAQPQPHIQAQVSQLQQPQVRATGIPRGGGSNIPGRGGRGGGAGVYQRGAMQGQRGGRGGMRGGMNPHAGEFNPGGPAAGNKRPRNDSEVGSGERGGKRPRGGGGGGGGAQGGGAQQGGAQ